jgi:uncharacterized protein YjiS (DUF1127 family)
MTGLRARSVTWVRTAVERKTMRSALGKLSREHLDDIGLSFDVAQIEVQKPFWRA